MWKLGGAVAGVGATPTPPEPPCPSHSTRLVEVAREARRVTAIAGHGFAVLHFLDGSAPSQSVEQRTIWMTGGFSSAPSTNSGDGGLTLKLLEYIGKPRWGADS